MVVLGVLWNEPFSRFPCVGYSYGGLELPLLDERKDGRNNLFWFEQVWRSFGVSGSGTDRSTIRARYAPHFNFNLQIQKTDPRFLRLRHS